MPSQQSKDAKKKSQLALNAVFLLCIAVGITAVGLFTGSMFLLVAAVVAAVASTTLSVLSLRED